MTERILTRYGDPDVEMEDGDIEYPLERTNILPADSLAAQVFGGKLT